MVWRNPDGHTHDFVTTTSRLPQNQCITLNSGMIIILKVSYSCWEKNNPKLLQNT